MRILLVTDFYHPYHGGVEVHVETIATELHRRGHEVTVATMGPPPGHPERSLDGTITVREIPHLAARLGRGVSSTDRPWAPPFPDPLAMLALRRVVRDVRPDVIHGHDWLARSALPRLVSGSTPIVTSLHYYTRTCAKKTLWRHRRPCPGPAPWRCVRCAADHYGPARGVVVALGARAGAAIEDRRTARWISVSSATENGNQLAGRAGSVVIANPLTVAPSGTGRVPTVPTGSPIGDLPAGDFVVYVGDLRAEKGVTVLLAAMNRLHERRGAPVPLVLVGERMTDDLDLPDGTIELGPVAHDAVPAIMACATVAVVPSLWPEPFGLVATEAMAAGCPVVASDVGGLSEILGDGRGILVPPGDPDALAGALDELLDDPRTRHRLAAAAHRSLDRYDPGDVVDAIEAEYRAVIG